MVKFCKTTHSMQDIKNTITNPNVKSIIQAISTILHSQMQEDLENQIQNGKEAQNQSLKNSDLYFFNEEKYIQEKPDDFDQDRKILLRNPPSVNDIYEFMKALYDCAQFSPECCIITLIYINRLISYTSLTLSPTNWRPILVILLLVAQKFQDDKYLSNASFTQIYPFFTIEEINKLESKVLILLEYNLTVKSGLYAKYYYELRLLFKRDQAQITSQKNIQSGAAQQTRSSQNINNQISQKLSLSNQEAAPLDCFID